MMYPSQEPTGAAPYFPQVPFPSQEPTGAAPYFPQVPFPSQEPTGTVPYFPQIPFPPQQPLGMISYSAQEPFSQQNSHIPSQAYEELHNLPAQRAIINGVIALVLSLFTLFILAGLAGLITGTLAIVYGLMGLRTAKQLPSNMGRGLAISGIALGSIAWFMALLLLIIRIVGPST